jgi:processive 1,2-diacylglycerol beta-glucosyltransferase
MPKILIVSVRAGAGHVKAAEAVEAAFLKFQPHAIVKRVELLDHSSAFIKYLYGKMYLDVVKVIPDLYAYNYKHYESAGRFIKPRFFVDKFNFSDFFEVIQEFDPDIVVGTHFIPPALLATYRRRKKKKFKIAVTLTDYEFHPLWLVPDVDLYFTATEEVKDSLLYYGVEAKRVVVSGIPIHPKFSEPKSKDALLAKHGLNGESPIILVSAGSFGITPLEEVIEDFQKIEDRFQIIIVCGNNAELKEKLEPRQEAESRLKKVFGYVDFMDELMAVSDLLITKPGGITVAEGLAVGLPMIFIEPIPGQEEANADYIIEIGVGVKARNLPVLIYKLGLLIRDSERLRMMSRKARDISRPNSANVVVKETLRL